jgi:ankyrin repeat protein
MVLSSITYIMNQEFLQATESGNKETVLALYSKVNNNVKQNAIIIGLKHKQNDIVKELLSKDTSQINYNKLLLHALFYGAFDIIPLLVERGADLHFKNEYALKWLATCGKMASAGFLIDRDADIYSDNNFLLEWASQTGEIEMVKLLLENGIDFHKNNDSALILAAKHGHLEIVKLYVESCRDDHCMIPEDLFSDNVNIVFRIDKHENGYNDKMVNSHIQFNKNKGIAIGKALDNKHYPIVNYLAENGAVINNNSIINAFREHNNEMAIYLIDKSQLQNPADILSVACRSGNMVIVKYMIETKGIDPNSMRSIYRQEFKSDILSYLLDNGLDKTIAMEGVLSMSMPDIETLETYCKILVEKGVSPIELVNYALDNRMKYDLISYIIEHYKIDVRSVHIPKYTSYEIDAYISRKKLITTIRKNVIMLLKYLTPSSLIIFGFFKYLRYIKLIGN